MAQVGDMVVLLIEEEGLGGGAILHPHPAVVVDIWPDGSRASLWEFAPQRVNYWPSVYKSDNPSKNQWMEREDWEAYHNG